MNINILLFMYISLFVSLAADKKNSNSPLIMSWVCFVSIAAVEIVRAVFRATMGKTVSVGLVCSNIFVKGFCTVCLLQQPLILLTFCLNPIKQLGPKPPVFSTKTGGLVSIIVTFDYIQSCIYVI